MNDNFILLTDSYKNSHDPQYPPKTTRVSSYFEPRAGAKFDRTLFFGLQYPIKRYFTKPITMEDIDEAESFFVPHMGGFNRAKWEYIVREHQGYLPLRIRAVPEGTLVPSSNVLMTVENTDDNCFWLTNYSETLLVQTWYPSTVATQSQRMKALIARYLDSTGDLAGLNFKLHDFGCRGVSCMEQAAVGGAAHLVNFQGTDTVPALKFLREYYYEHMAGNSINASEHSTITSWGEKFEVDAMRNMIQQYGDNALYACVSDSYDLIRAVGEYWGGVLKADVLAHKGTLVVRPDSGDAKSIVPQVIKLLYEKFGGEVNKKGYIVLNPKVRVIQGDGIDFETLDDILWHVKAAGFSTDNIAFGSGGGLLQKLNRDTQRFAFKCSQVVVDGEERNVSKSPLTDPTKTSKAGRLELYEKDGHYTTSATPVDGARRVMRTVYENGMLLINEPLSVIRERAHFNWEA